MKIALVIFILTYAGIIFTRIPKINIDRPSAAFFGSVAMILFGVLTFNEAMAAIDFNTICLLLGMMLIIATLEIDGFFSLIAEKTVRVAHTQRALLIIIIFVTGISSAFLVNDAVVLLFTPVLIAICTSSNLNPVPYLIAEILASNAGSAMTMTGNPQNMLIGINSGISYGKFLMLLAPVSILSMFVIFGIILLMYPAEFKIRKKIIFAGSDFEYDYKSMKFSVPIFIFVIVMFFIGGKINMSIPVIALTGGSLVLVFGRIKPSKIIKEVDWVLLLFFAALFIVVRGVEKTGLLETFLKNALLTPDFKGVAFLHALSLFASQAVSNVPFTVIMIPFMKIADSGIMWLALASASTLAGNATIIGAMANLIVIESAQKRKIKIGFFEFLKSGIIVTLLTLIISMAVICFWILIGVSNF